MNTTTLIAWVREQASISDESTEYDDPKILQLLNQARIEIFEPVIASTRAGYWTHTLTRTLGANNPVVRLPPRAAAFLHADVRRDGGDWCPLQEALESEQQDWERDRSGTPRAYLIRGTTMHLLNAPTTSQYTLRVKVIVRPSVLYATQANGLVTGIDLTTNTLTLNGLPADKSTNTTISGTLNVDVIEPIDNYELSLFHAPATVLDGTHVQVDSSYSLLKVQIGDYLRVANQSEWPQLPEPFHSSLASAAAIPPCVQRDLYDRVTDLRSDVSSAATRLATHLMPRTKTRTDERQPIMHSWT
jgi:hypothetical protein